MAECMIQGCDKPGEVTLSGRYEDPISKQLVEHEGEICADHSKQMFGDMAGLFSIGEPDA